MAQLLLGGRFHRQLSDGARHNTATNKPSPDNLLEVTSETSLSQPLNFNSSGSTGFDYLDSAGILTGQVSGTLNLSFGITFGVDMFNGSPDFFVEDSSNANPNTGLTVTFSASAGLTGDLAIG